MHNHPPTPETWAIIMLAVLALFGVTAVVLFVLGGFTLVEFLCIALLLGFAVVSVKRRYMATPQPPAEI